MPVCVDASVEILKYTIYKKILYKNKGESTIIANNHLLGEWAKDDKEQSVSRARKQKS